MEEKYIELYDKLGCEEFAKGSDEQLMEWGNSQERIREIKIECIKGRLKWHEKGIECYKFINELCGGKNAL